MPEGTWAEKMGRAGAHPSNGMDWTGKHQDAASTLSPRKLLLPQ
ncbi:hypothetical protein [Geitlerinema calcuttense]|uniref:Uncharacterized protein n=1 Tax=Geitlerinema calcuttense NRMC-F 0142 TaxID=2922238 RepID=A0ABT7LZM2_9CYAN|nr:MULTISPECIES: hypothetical protein [Cyanophyceae]MDL5054210.1 hypothetical protein [Oscillatoria laete-virens NRMC-F 0139]MDL5057459.1 hypothetical protein [Geitlerinema calcuttense NRMC-F 0142]